MWQNLTPEEAVQLLKDGNRRFSNGLRTVASMNAKMKLVDLAHEGQKPISIILTCSDSRLPTETLFDLGLGDLYVLRVAGNALSDVFMSGIEYAMKYFDVPLCVVLGHTQCGAIQAVYDHRKTPLDSPNLVNLCNAISTQKILPASALDLTWQNIRQSVLSIQNQIPLVKARVEQKKIKILGALYDLETGNVKFED